MSTTISCRLVAGATALLLLITGAPTAGAPALPTQLPPVPALPPEQLKPVPPLPPEQLQPVPPLPPEQVKPVPPLPPRPIPQSPMAKPEKRPEKRQEPRGPQPLPSAPRWSIAIPASTVFPPAMNDRQVFAFVPPGSIASFGLADGAERWRVEMTPEHPLAVNDELLLVAAGDAMHALDVKTGAILWREQTGTLTAPPLVHEGWVVIAAAGEVIARRATDGAVLWRQPHGTVQRRPTIEGDTLFLPIADSRVMAVDLTTGATRWERKLGGAPSEIAALGGRVYVGSADKYFYCLDAADGDREWRPRLGAAVIGRPAIDAERVYVATTDNLVRAFDRVDGALKWHAALPFRPYGGPLLFGTALVAPGAVAELQTLDVATGKPGPPMTFGAPLAAPFTIRASDAGPLAAAITSSVTGEVKLSLWETSTSIPTAALTVLPGTPVPLPAAPPPGSAAR